MQEEETKEIPHIRSTRQVRMESDNELDVVPLSSFRFKLEEAKKESLAEASSVEGSKRVGKKRKLRKLVTDNRASLAKLSQE